MAFKITEECLACGTCMDSCPHNAIVEGDIYKITDACQNCGTCAEACPVGAIIEE